MAPQAQREFDKQITAVARLFYFEEDGVFQGIVSHSPQPVMLLPLQGLQSTPCGPTCEAKLCSVSSMRWSWLIKPIWMQPSSSPAVVAKEPRLERALDTGHWTALFVYSSSSNPYPIELQVVGVERVAFSWNEYAGKMAPDRKAGDYSASTFQGPPIIVPTPAPSDALQQGPKPRPRLSPDGLLLTFARASPFCMFATPHMQDCSSGLI